MTDNAWRSERSPTALATYDALIGRARRIRMGEKCLHLSSRFELRELAYCGPTVEVGDCPPIQQGAILVRGWTVCPDCGREDPGSGIRLKSDRVRIMALQAQVRDRPPIPEFRPCRRAGGELAGLKCLGCDGSEAKRGTI